MNTESPIVSRRVEYGQDHFNSAIGQLDDPLREILKRLETKSREVSFQVLGENPEIEALVEEALEAHIPFPFIDFVILNHGIQDEGDKQLYLMSKHDDYLQLCLYPSHAILAQSQGFDLTEVMPYGTPVTGNRPQQIAY